MNLQSRLASLIPKVQNELDKQILQYEENISRYVHTFLEEHMEHMLLNFFGLKKDSCGSLQVDKSCIPIAISAKLTNAAETYIANTQISLTASQIKAINAEYRRILESKIRDKLYMLANSHANMLTEVVHQSVLKDFTKQSLQDIDSYVKTFELISSEGGLKPKEVKKTTFQKTLGP